MGGRRAAAEARAGLALTEVIIALLLMTIVAVSLLAGLLAVHRMTAGAVQAQRAMTVGVGALDSLALTGGAARGRYDVGSAWAEWQAEGGHLVALIVRGTPPDTLRIELLAWPRADSTER
jgi:Tfp pilus assembly protein PilV